jgi:hypothetical protein
MTVKKKVNRYIRKFIDDGADVKDSKDKEFKNILIRVPISVLIQLAEAIEKKPWIYRTQWIVEAIHEKLKRDLHED